MGRIIGKVVVVVGGGVGDFNLHDIFSAHCLCRVFFQVHDFSFLCLLLWAYYFLPFYLA